MSIDLGLAIDMQSVFSSGKFLAITSDEVNNSSFILHTLIQHKSKTLRSDVSGGPLVLLLMNQSYSHYSFVAAKSFGLNLKTLRDAGKLRVVDVVKNVDQYLDKSSEEFDLKSLEENFMNQMTSFCTLIIDDLSVLSCLGLPAKEIYKFVLKLRCLPDLCLVIQSSKPLEEDCMEWSRALDCLISSSDLYLCFQRLETGFSDRVDGSLDVHDLQTYSSKTYHYKTAERNTKLFVPGFI